MSLQEISILISVNYRDDPETPQPGGGIPLPTPPPRGDTREEPYQRFDAREHSIFRGEATECSEL